MSDIFSEAIDDIHADENFSYAALYTDENGTVPVTLIRRKGSNDMYADGTTLRFDTILFEVRKAQVPVAKQGAVLELVSILDGVVTVTGTYVVKARPEQMDEGRSWLLDVREE